MVNYYYSILPQNKTPPKITGADYTQVAGTTGRSQNLFLLGRMKKTQRLIPLGLSHVTSNRPTYFTLQPISS